MPARHPPLRPPLPFSRPPRNLPHRACPATHALPIRRYLGQLLEEAEECEAAVRKGVAILRAYIQQQVGASGGPARVGLGCRREGAARVLSARLRPVVLQPAAPHRAYLHSHHHGIPAAARRGGVFFLPPPLPAPRGRGSTWGWQQMGSAEQQPGVITAAPTAWHERVAVPSRDTPVSHTRIRASARHPASSTPARQTPHPPHCCCCCCCC